MITLSHHPHTSWLEPRAKLPSSSPFFSIPLVLFPSSIWNGVKAELPHYFAPHSACYCQMKNGPEMNNELLDGAAGEHEDVRVGDQALVITLRDF